MPLYTYACDAGHQWDEIRGLDEDSARSSEPCATCLEIADCAGVDLGDDLSCFAGKKVPSQISVKLNGPGFTPKFYPNREQK